jgi:hypothetical protein
MNESRQVIIRDSETGKETVLSAEHLSIEVVAGSATIPLFEGNKFTIEKFTPGKIMPPTLAIA